MVGINQDKYQEAILYFTKECQNVRLGKTKLAKLLYYLDFDHYEEHGSSVTGDTYRKREYGPLAEHAERMLEVMQQEELLERELRPVIEYQRERYIPKAEPNLDVFTETEKQTLKAVCERWADATRHEIVEETHNEAPWIAVEYGDIIPYQYAYYRNKFGELDETEDETEYFTVDELLEYDVRA